MYKLVANNKQILDKSNNISWTSDADTLGVELSFDSLYDLAEGSIVSLYINNKEYIRSIIIKKVEDKFTFSYSCLDYSFYLKNEVVKQFNKVSASSAITSLLREFNIKSRIVNIPTKISKIYNGDEISRVIDDILEQAEKEQNTKYIKEMDVDTVVINKLTSMRIYPKILISSDISINSSIEGMKNKVLVVGSGENIKILATAEDKLSQSRFGLLQQVESIDEKEKGKARSIATNLLKDLNKIMKDTSFDVMAISGAETIKANRLIEVKAGKLNGWYKIKSATHTLSNNNHKVSISLEW